MSDNTQINTGTGDTIRDLDRTGTGVPKTQVVALDVGGAAANPESLVSTFSNNPLPVKDDYLASAKSADAPLAMFSTGDPSGEFAGVNVWEEAFAGRLSLPVQTPDLRKDALNALMFSDCPVPVIGTATASSTTNGFMVVDTQGYQSVSFTNLAGAGSLAFYASNDGIGWVLTYGIVQQANLAPTSFASGVNFSAANPALFQLPAIARFIQLRLTSLSGTAPVQIMAQLKQAPCSNINSGFNLSTFGGTAPNQEGLTASAFYLGVSGRGRTTTGTAIGNGSTSPFSFSSSGQLLIEAHAPPELFWNYAAASGGISNTVAAVTIKAAVAAQRGNISQLDLSADALGAATEVAIRDGAAGTVMWRCKVGTAGIPTPTSIKFDPPLRQAAVNTLLEVVTLTASITGGVYINAQGFMSL